MHSLTNRLSNTSIKIRAIRNLRSMAEMILSHLRILMKWIAAVKYSRASMALKLSKWNNLHPNFPKRALLPPQVLAWAVPRLSLLV